MQPTRDQRTSELQWSPGQKSGDATTETAEETAVGNKIDITELRLSSDVLRTLVSYELHLRPALPVVQQCDRLCLSGSVAIFLSSL